MPRVNLKFPVFGKLNTHLGNVRVSFTDADQDGKPEITQEQHYEAYGLRLGGLTYMGGEEERYLYNGIERIGELGLGWYQALYRGYNPALGRWMQTDPKYNYSESVYAGFGNNPILLTDQLGDTTFVTHGKEKGTYDVIGGTRNDNHNGIYLKENGKLGKMIGYSATPESFYHSDKKEWGGTINPNDQSGERFINEEIIEGDPFIVSYMWYARGGEHYDFKGRGTRGTQDPDYQKIGQQNRGMPIFGTKDGLPIFASARDVGNIAAGIVAGREGMGWETARIGFDGLESLQQGRLSSEGSQTQWAQRLGHRIGIQYYQKEELSKLPGNGHLKYLVISKGIITR